MGRWPALLLGLGALACAAPAARSGSEPASARASSPAARSPLPAAAAPESSSQAPQTAGRPAPSASAVARDETPFVRELEQPVRAIAIDKAPHVSALGERVVHVHDRKGFREEALPAAALGDARLEIFYGRDYRLRLVGTRQGERGLETLYYRWLPGGFRPAPDEIGRLGSTRSGGFVALLGTADPEVVCRPGDVCLVKRVSGWATIAAPPSLDRLAIDSGGAWAVAERSLLTVEQDKAWKVLSEGAPWARATALWVARGAVWVIERDADMLHRFDGATWQSSSSPSKRPQALWSAGDHRLWLGGEEGLFHHDGSAWRKVVAITGSVSAIAGRGEEDLWVGGGSGLFRSSTARDQRR